jgi:hypothetical protein
MGGSPRASRPVAAAKVTVCLIGSLMQAASGSTSAAGTSATATATATSTAPGGVTPVARTDGSGTVWLCRPGLASDPCAANLAVTTVPASGPRTVANPAPATQSAFDCFYVYPTVSTQPAANADLRVQASEIGAAIAQASPFSQVCRVWAPIYRQRTAASLAKGLGADKTADTIAYRSVLAGWTDYLKHFNDGRPVIFIGHSQGAAMLIRLLASQIDSNPTLRSRMVSAVIAGGNVAVPKGQEVGATFRHLPLCTSVGEIGCVIAYSSFSGPPPTDSLFGRPGQGVSLQSGQTRAKGLQVACVNPADLGGGTGQLTPWFLSVTSVPPPPPVTTPWVTYPKLYTATCRNSGGATWLQIDDGAGANGETLGPTWGLHLDDLNLASGNRVNDVRQQEWAYTAARS